MMPPAVPISNCPGMRTFRHIDYLVFLMTVGQAFWICFDRVRRMLSSASSMRRALWTSRSRMALVSPKQRFRARSVLSIIVSWHANEVRHMEYARAEDGRPWFSARERVRKREFESVWDNELRAVFRDVAPYYDLASDVASLGLYSRWRRLFVSSINMRPADKILDICAGTNAIGRGLLQREPRVHVYALDKSEPMQQVGQVSARSLGFEIESVIGDVHQLPFPDESFDIVTLGWASRHLRIVDVLTEVKRILKPGGVFHHCDMLRPRNPLIERLYCAYLKACVTFTALAFRSGPEAWRCRTYFVDTIRRFYSAEELSDVLFQVGYSNVLCWRALGGVVAFHKAVKV